MLVVLGSLGCAGVLGVVALIAFFLGINVFATREEAGLVRAQLADLRRGDFPGAYGRMAGEYRAHYTLDQFKAFVAEHPALADNKDVSFPSREWSIDVSTVTFQGAVLTSRSGMSEVFNIRVSTDSEGRRGLGIERGVDVKAMLAEGTDVNAPVKDRAEALHTPLRVAIEASRPEVALALVERGADANAEHVLYRAALATYSGSGMEDVALALVEKGADVRAGAPDAEPGVPTVLHAAIHSGATRLVRALIGKGADVQAVDKDSGQTVLHFAVSRRGDEERPEIVEALLAAGADVHARDARGNTPLNLVPVKRRRTITLLLDRHAEVDARDSDGHPVLYTALRECEAETATLLLARGASRRLPKHDLEDLARVEDHCRTGSPPEMARIQAAVTAVVRTLEVAPN